MAKHKESLPLAPRQKIDPRRFLNELLAFKSKEIFDDGIEYFTSELEERDVEVDEDLVSSLRDTILIAAIYNNLAPKEKSMVSPKGEVRRSMQSSGATSPTASSNDMGGATSPPRLTKKESTMNVLGGPPAAEPTVGALISPSSQSKVAMLKRTPSAIMRGGESTKLLHINKLFEGDIIGSDELSKKVGGGVFHAIHEMHSNNPLSSSAIYGEQPLMGHNGLFKQQIGDKLREVNDEGLKPRTLSSSMAILLPASPQSDGPKPVKAQHKRNISHGSATPNKGAANIQQDSVDILKRAALKRSDSRQEIVLKVSTAFMGIMEEGAAKQESSEATISAALSSVRSGILTPPRPTIEQKAQKTLEYLQQLVANNNVSASTALAEIWAKEMAQQVRETEPALADSSVSVEMAKVDSSIQELRAVVGSKDDRISSHDVIAFWKSKLKKKKGAAGGGSVSSGIDTGASPGLRVIKKQKEVPRWERLWLDAKRRQDEDTSKKSQEKKAADERLKNNRWQ
jgi:hypothetical protein